MWFDLHWPVKSKYYHQTLDYQPPDFCWKTYIKNISSLLAVRKENLETLFFHNLHGGKGQMQFKEN